MIIHAQDAQVVGEVQSTLWSTFQQGSSLMALIIKNSGVNTMNYQLQEFTGSTWQVIGNAPLGTDYYSTLSPNQVKVMVVNSSYSQVQMVGNASGGALLEFDTSRYFNRANGGPIPILNL